MSRRADCLLVEAALSVLGRAWAGAVLQVMLDGNERYSDIRRALPGITDAVLTRRLRELAERGFLVRAVEPGPPTSVTYRLTAAGRDTREVLDTLASFARRRRELLA